MVSTTTETVGVPSTTTETVGDTTLPDGPWVVIPARQTDPEEDDNNDDSGGILIAMLAKTHGPEAHL